MLHSRHMNCYKRRFLIIISILLFTFAMSESSQASFVDPIDQTSDTANENPTSVGGSKGVGQSFTASKTGWMYYVETFVMNTISAREISLTIREGENINGTVLGIATVGKGNKGSTEGEWIRFTFNDGIPIESNKRYTMMMESTNDHPGQVIEADWGIYSPGLYDGGKSYAIGNWHEYLDFAFRTYVADQERDYSTSVEINSLTTTYGDTNDISATLLDAQNQVLVNKKVTFSLDGSFLGSSNTNENGEAILSYSVNTSIGDHTIKASFAGDSTYLTSEAVASMSVAKRPLVVTPADATRAYGTGNPVFTGAITGALSSDGITATFASSADQMSTVGKYAIEATLADPNNKLGNYEVTKSAGNLSVTKAQLTVTPHTISRWVNNENPFLDGDVTGVLNNDNISAKYVTLAEQSSPIGSYTIEAEIIDPNQRLGNYEVTKNNAELSVYDVPRLTYATNDTASSVTGHLVLPVIDDKGRSIQWVSSNNQFVDGATGHVQRPSYKEGNKSVTLKATITADGATYEAIYPLIIVASRNTSSGTSPGASHYIETVTANGKQRLELKLDDLNNGFATIESDSEVAEFIMSKATLTQVMAISPSLKLKFITAKDEITIPIQELAIAGNNRDLTITIGRADTIAEFVGVNNSHSANVWTGPVVFNVNGLDDQGRSSEITAFGSYVERKIELDAPNSDFATVVLWDEEKQMFTFVPAQFVKENGKVTALVKSTRNGYFFVIDRRVSFVDLQNHWAKSDIELLAAKFIVQGRNEMNFDPNGMLTRAETAALLVRALGIPLNNNEFSFADVDGKWYEADVIAAEQAGLIKGYSDGTFRPNNRVTREELAVMLIRAIEYANPSLQTANKELASADVENISPWAVDSIQQVLSLGIIKGDQQGNVKPQAEATRAEMVTLLSRMLKILNFV